MTPKANICKMGERHPRWARNTFQNILAESLSPSQDVSNCQCLTSLHHPQTNQNRWTHSGVHVSSCILCAIQIYTGFQRGLQGMQVENSEKYPVFHSYLMHRKTRRIQSSDVWLPVEAHARAKERETQEHISLYLDGVPMITKML